VLFLAHRRELINQTVGKLVAAGVPAHSIGVMMGGDRRTNAGAPIQVASIDTLRNRDRPPANVLMIDEAHRSLAATYRAVIEHYASSGATVLGLTATPHRADGGGLGDVYEHIEAVATPRELVELGFIVEPRVFSAPSVDLSHVRVRAGEYHEGDLADAFNSSALIGNIVGHWQRHAVGLRTVAFAVKVVHSQNITARFGEAGVPAEHLDGEAPARERDAILARLDTGETLVVSNCGVLCEGWDQPAVKCGILAWPTKSTGLYLQQAGRILRARGRAAWTWGSARFVAAPLEATAERGARTLRRERGSEWLRNECRILIDGQQPFELEINICDEHGRLLVPFTFTERR
jgi:superfamily II DNA or RNA helicase